MVGNGERKGGDVRDRRGKCFWKRYTNAYMIVKGKSKAPVQEDDEEEELRKLQAEMAM